MKEYDDLFESAECGDPYAIYEIAHLYDIGLLDDDSESKYIFWFKRFWSLPEVQAAINNYDEDAPNDDRVTIVDEVALRDYIIEAGLALGLYYMNSGNIEEARFAYQCLNDAWVASRFGHEEIETVDGKKDFLKLIQEQQAWINELEEDGYERNLFK